MIVFVRVIHQFQNKDLYSPDVVTRVPVVMQAILPKANPS